MKKKPLILALETSGRLGSIAIAIGDQLLAEKTFSAPLKHSEEVFPAISNLLNDLKKTPDEINHIYISVGPGSFTGLRIAVTIAKLMSLANAVKIVTVDTLDVIAANLSTYEKSRETSQNEKIFPPKNSNPLTDIKKIATILDAKRSQFFIAAYRKKIDRNNTGLNQWEKTLPDSLMTAEQFIKKFTNTTPPIHLLGEGLLYYKDKFKAKGIEFLDETLWQPRAANVHKLGYQKAQAKDFANPLTLQPAYQRHPEAEEKSNR
jgi:tRNA threonylcarbamoyladenosine biosynthesis protein TsaB